MSNEFDASDPKAVADARAAAGRKQKKLDDFIAAAVETSQGRFWIWDMLIRCHIFQPVTVFGQFDASAFRDGERNIGLQLIAQLTRVAPDAYILMMKENTSE